MNREKTLYQIPYIFMNDFVKRKYNNNVKETINSIKISPKHYTLKSNLNKSWFIYFWYYRSGENKRRKYEKARISINGQNININKIKDHKYKIELIETLKDRIVYELQTEPRFILKLLYGNNKAKELYPSIYTISSKTKEEEKTTSIEYAFNEVLENKTNISSAYYNDMRSVKERFFKYLGNNKKDATTLLSKKMIVSFLNGITLNSSNRTYNNIKTNLKTYLEGLKDLEYIDRNFLDGVKNKQIKSKLKRAFTTEELETLFKETKAKDYELYLFLMHTYYGVMRAQTVVRIKAKDIDLKDNRFLTDTKTGNFIKIIPKQLRDEFYSKIDFSKIDPEAYIFGRNGLFKLWEAKDENRVRHYTDRFKPFKVDLFNDEKEVTFYSSRYKSIGDIFEAKCKELKEAGAPDYMNTAIRYIMPITNHTTLEQTKSYLLDLSTAVHEDWSKYL